MLKSALINPFLSPLFHVDFVLNTVFHSDKAFDIRQRSKIINAKR